VYRQHWTSILWRDIVVIGCCITREHSSLRGFWYVARNWKRVLAKRQHIMERRRVSDEYMASWFSYQPVSKPAPETPVVSSTRQQRVVRGR
jgi:hypothetical protein